MKPPLSEILSCMGHTYVPAESGDNVVASRIRHIVRAAPELDGELSPICADPPKQIGDDEWAITLPALYRDSNCPQCRAIEGFDDVSLTKRVLMVNTVNHLINLEHMFIEAYERSSTREPGETPFNFDPDGEMATSWLENYAFLLQCVERMKPTMEYHAKTFAWPDEVTETEQ